MYKRQKLNQFGNFNLYALSYKISGVKDDETHTAALDTTYTAENERLSLIHILYGESVRCTSGSKRRDENGASQTGRTGCAQKI